jgi:hypothetical protein
MASPRRIIGMILLLAVVNCGQVGAAETAPIAPAPPFSRQVVALFSRLGCNAGCPP